MNSETLNLLNNIFIQWKVRKIIKFYIFKIVFINYYFTIISGLSICILLAISLSVYSKKYHPTSILSISNLDATISSDNGLGSINQNSGKNSDQNSFADTVSLSGNTEFSALEMASNEHAKLNNNYGNNTINQIRDNNHNENVLNNTVHIVATSNHKKNSSLKFSIANLLATIFNNTGGFDVNQRNSNNHQENNFFSHHNFKK